ncbi:MAG: histone deacetylase family protein [Chloroflexota bacterium]|nr:histone deacetylase family protein [Chloroflexota bacterium]
MRIFYNKQHIHHDLIGRFVRQHGESHLFFFEQPKATSPAQPHDDQETPARMQFITQALQAAGVTHLEPPRDLGREVIEAVHDAGYLEYLENVYADYAAQTGVEAPVYPEAFAFSRTRRRPHSRIAQRGYYGMDVYTPITAGTWRAAYWGAQTAANAADAVLNGAPLAYALCRPSGHHAGRDFYGGYCFLNNCAVAARMLADRTKQRIAILDFDFHHGNGTQDIFYSTPDVIFVSLHGQPDQAFPYFWGFADEVGSGAGAGANRNIPLPKGTTTHQYLEALDEALKFIQAFKPAYLVVSAGFDIGPGDPYGGFEVDTDGMRAIGERLGALNHAGLPMVIIQEGGYVPHQLGHYVVSFFGGMGVLT